MFSPSGSDKKVSGQRRCKNLLSPLLIAFGLSISSPPYSVISLFWKPLVREMRLTWFDRARMLVRMWQNIEFTSFFYVDEKFTHQVIYFVIKLHVQWRSTKSVRVAKNAREWTSFNQGTLIFKIFRWKLPIPLSAERVGCSPIPQGCR